MAHDLQPLVLKLGTEIERQLPQDVKFLLVVAQKENGKCATNLHEPLRSKYLKKVIESLESQTIETLIIEAVL